MAAQATTVRRKILNAYLDDNGREIVVREVSPKGPSVERRVPAEYVTWHRAEDLGRPRMRQLKALDIVRGIQTVGSYVRISWDGEQGRYAGRRGMQDQNVETYEGDIDPVLLWSIENRVEIAKPKRCYVDLEADSRVPLSQKEDMRILSWAIVDHDSGEEFVGVLESDDDDAEEALLRDLRARLLNYDQIAVWEGDWRGGEFDSVVLPARMRAQGIDFDERRWLWLNQLAVWKRMNSAESGAEKESFKLEDIAHAQIGEGKETVPDWVVERFGAEKTARGLGAMSFDLWNEGGEFRDLLVRYNARDAQLLRKLEVKKGFINLFQSLCDVCGIPPVTKSLFPTRQMDSFMLRLGRERDHRFPTKKWREEGEEGEEKEEEDKFRGALVIHPKSVPGESEGPDKWTAEDARRWRLEHGMKNGILRDVHVCDFASLYPSIMRTFNLSADAVLGFARDIATARKMFGENVCFSPGTDLVTRTDIVGFLPLALAELIRLRKHWSDLAASLPPGTPEWIDAKAKSDAYKVAANSFYGAGGSKFSRFYNRAVSEACTQNAVHFLKITAAEATKRKMFVAYGDTDSVFAFGPSEDGYRKFIGWLNSLRFPAEVASHGCVENHIKLTFEKTFSRLVFVTAKAYVGRYSQYKGKRAEEDSEPEIKGLAWKRGDKGRLARELQGRIIDCLVGGVKVRTKDGKKVPINEDWKIATPTEDVSVYRAIVERTRDYVLEGKLPLDEVRFSKGLSKSLREYGKDATEVHVRIARMLKDRGQSVGKGTRIEYVVVDASASPQLAIPAEDYTGECDRYYLWERVFSPAKSLLEAAFPDEDWTRYEKVRPPKPRKPKPGTENQLGFNLDRPKLRVIEGGKSAKKVDEFEELAVSAYRASNLVIRIPEAAGKGAIERVAEVIKDHPGARPVRVVIALATGAEAVLSLDARVAPSPRFREAIEEAIQPEPADPGAPRENEQTTS